MVKNTAHFRKNRKNHGKITAVSLAANLLKLKKKYILGKWAKYILHNVTVTYSASK